HDQDVGSPHPDLGVGHDVIGQMAVDRGHHFFLAGFDIDHKAQQSAPIVGFREALSMEQPAAFQLGIGEQEAVGGDQADPGMFRPDGQQLPKQSSGGGLP